MIALDKNHYPKYIEQLHTFTEHTSPISDKSWKKIVDIMKLWRVPKGTRLLDFMQVESAVRFLGTGIVKCEDTFNNKTYVYDYRVAPIILSEAISLLNNTPSTITLETCTECDFIELPREPFIDLMFSDMDISRFCMIGVANYLAMMHYKHGLLRTLEANERYKLFLKEFPQVALQCKLEDIASYLNVTQPSLSRIRKNIVWEENESELEFLSNELEVVHGKKEA